MLVAVCTLTRNNLDLVEKNFAALHEFAGAEFHHYVLDQDSTDGLDGWLRSQAGEGTFEYVHYAGQSQVGVRGYNHLIEAARRHGGYDVIVLMDHRCEFKEQNTIDRLARVARADVMISPIVDGLHDYSVHIGPTYKAGLERLKESKSVDGFCLATPIGFWDDFRFPEDMDGHEAFTFLSQFCLNEQVLMATMQGLRVNCA